MMTSSPGPMPSAISATSSASVPDDTPMACATPSWRASLALEARRLRRPRMKRWLSHTRVIAASTSSRIVAPLGRQIQQRDVDRRASAGRTRVTCYRLL